MEMRKIYIYIYIHIYAHFSLSLFIYIYIYVYTYGHENSHPLELRFCWSQTLRSPESSHRDWPQASIPLFDLSTVAPPTVEMATSSFADANAYEGSQGFQGCGFRLSTDRFGSIRVVFGLRICVLLFLRIGAP